MKVAKYTPMVGLKQRALNAKLGEAAQLIYDRIKASGEDIPLDVIKAELWEFLVLSARATFDKDEVDFETAQTADSTAEIAVKYLGYLASETYSKITEAWAAIFTLDGEVATDPATAPSAPEGADPKS